MTVNEELTMLAAAFALVALWLLVLTVRQRKLNAFFRAIARGGSRPSLEQTVYELVEKVDSIEVRARELSARLQRVEGVSGRAVTGVGLVRYNPFPDTGGNFSWSLALLDESGDGVIVTALNGRHESRFYLKEIAGLRCELPLSDEEEEALRKAAGKRG